MSRYCTDIGADIVNIGSDIRKKSRYRVLVTPHRRHGAPQIGPSSEWLPERASLVQTACGGARRKTLSNPSKADITNIGSDIGEKITISCLGDTISENAISGHTLISAECCHDIGADIVI